MGFRYLPHIKSRAKQFNQGLKTTTAANSKEAGNENAKKIKKGAMLPKNE